MKILTNILLGILVLLVAYSVFFTALPAFGASSPAGTSFNTEKQASIAINLANPGANGTSTSILNTDASDRFVTSTKLVCNGVGTSQTAYTGAGLSSIQMSVGTTTTAAPASFTSFAAVMRNQALGTTTTVLMVASSTLLTATSSLAAEWPANTYMTFYFNATNTAACTAGVNYTAG